MSYNPMPPQGQSTKSGSLPVTVASDDDLQAKIGIVTETAPASDTASSGLNGRLQRIAQRLTSLIALIPAALTGSGNFKAALVEDTTSNKSVNVAQVAGTTTDTNSGTKSAGTQRFVIATDQPQLTNALKVDGSAVTQPISASSLPLPTGAATETTVAAVNTAIGAQADAAASADTGTFSLIAVIKRIVAKLTTINTTLGSPFQAGGTVGTNADANIAAGTAPSKALIGGGVYNSTAPAPTNGQTAATQFDQAGNQRVFNGIASAALSVWNSGTSLNATQNIFTNSGADAVLVYLVQSSGSFSAGAITFEITYDGTNWVTCPAQCILDPSSATFAQIAVPYTLVTSTNKPLLIELNGAQGLRIKLSTAITGTGTVTPNYSLLNYSPAQQVIALSPTAANFKVDPSGVTSPVSIAGNQAVNVAQVNGHTVLEAGTNGAQAVGGVVANNGTINSAVNPVLVGGQAVSSENAANTTAKLSQFVTDLVGKQIVLPYANPENFVSGTTAAMTATTSTSLVAAPGVGLRNYITTIIVSNSHASVGTDIVIQDGSGGTTLLTIPAASVYGGAVITLPTPLRQPTTNTALYCANVTTGASTKVSAVGYKGI